METMSTIPLLTMTQTYGDVIGSHGVRVNDLCNDDETMFRPHSLTTSLGDAYHDLRANPGSHRLKGGADNEINSDDDDYEEPDFADGDLDEVSREINVTDYDYAPEASPNPYHPTPQPELEGVIYVGGPPPNEDESSSSARPGSPRELACMSHKTVIAPFLNDYEEMNDITPPTKITSKLVPSNTPLLPKSSGTVADPSSKKRTEVEGSLAEDRTAKKQRSTKDNVIPPPTSSIVEQMCAKLGMQNATGVEIADWCNSEMESNNVAISKCLTEAWVRLNKENRITEVHASTHEEDLRKIEDRHKKELEKLQRDLKEAKSMIMDLEKAQGEANKLKEELIKNHEKEITELNTKAEVAAYDRFELEKEFVAQGKMRFRKLILPNLSRIK
ncbi:hypothetical protein POM88_035880 [Heracleum sosnowskyi]|uniref:Uncharacterized protein n=1 Tax=Heracleum sosnowskyi TaxID=360622 RepID=A0AAD8HN66_9APIA|nr:hypothetical protein POM88_035880 [Heracleum sosnowskyi]